MGAEAALVPVGGEPEVITSFTIAGSRIRTGTRRTAVTGEGNTESNFLVFHVDRDYISAPGS